MAASGAPRPAPPSLAGMAPDPSQAPPRDISPPVPEAPEIVALKALDEERRREGLVHQRLQEVLAALVSAEPMDPAAVQDALDAVLSSPAMHSVVTTLETERWLTSLLEDASPGTDLLIDRIFAHFEWDSVPVGRQARAPEWLRRRRDSLHIWRAMADPSHRVHQTWAALMNDPSGKQLWRNRLTIGLNARVKDLSDNARDEGLERLFNPRAVAWWKDHAAWLGLRKLSSGVVIFILLVVVLRQLPEGNLKQGLTTSIFAATPLLAFAGIVWIMVRVFLRRKRASPWAKIV